MVNGAITRTTLHVEFHLQAVAIRHRCQVLIGVHHRDLGRELNLAGRDRGRTAHHHTAHLGFTGLAADHQLLGIEKDIQHILPDTRQDRILVIGAGDANSGDSSALQTAQKRSPQGVPQGDGLASLEGADDEFTGLGAIVAERDVRDRLNLILQHELWRGGKRYDT